MSKPDTKKPAPALRQLSLGAGAPSPAPARDPYLEGFAEGRAPPTPRPEETAAAVRPAPALLRGLALVEPNFVRIVRDARGLTQPALAKLLGVHPDTISDWESAPGPIRIKLASYRRLAQLGGGAAATPTAR